MLCIRTTNEVKRKQQLIFIDKYIIMGTFELGGTKFKTKSDAKKFVSNYLMGNDSISKSDKIWIVDLLKRHPYWERKKQGVKDIIIKETGFNNKAFHLTYKDGGISAISYNRCFNDRTEKQNITRALRWDIIEQIKVFKWSIFKNGFIVNCEVCGVKLEDDENTHIDHIIKFSKIADAFIKLENIIETHTINYRHTITEEKQRQRWQEYHKKNAKLRPLCASCNMKIR